MRLEKNSSTNRQVARVVVAVAFTAICFFGSQSSLQAQSATKSADQTVDASKTSEVQQAVPNANQPYLLSSRLHLQMGTNKGYLVVRVDLAEGSYVYSLTQKGDARPTKLTVSPSPQFRLVGEFTPDRAAVSVDDPTSKQPLEKHKSLIQFFAPIEIAPGTDISNLTAEVVFDGQVCTAENFCMPIMSEKIAGKFAGYFRGDTQQQTSDSPARTAQSNSADSQTKPLQR